MNATERPSSQSAVARLCRARESAAFDNVEPRAEHHRLADLSTASSTSMLARSATFRRQCARIAGAPDLSIVIRSQPPIGTRLAGADAASAGYPNGRLDAVVSVAVCPAAAELIAHEIEHIIEQLDGVDLHAQGTPARQRRSSRQRPDLDAFETTRAIATGLRVAREVARRSAVGDGRDARPVVPIGRRRGRVRGHVARDAAATRAPDRRPARRLPLATGAAHGRRQRRRTLGRLRVAGPARPCRHRRPPGHLRARSHDRPRHAREAALGDGSEYSHPRISGDGRYLVFESRPADARQHRAPTSSCAIASTGATRVLTGHARQRQRSADGAASPEISDDGRVVAFSSAATTLTGGPDANGHSRMSTSCACPAGTITRASVDSAGVQPDRGEQHPAEPQRRRTMGGVCLDRSARRRRSAGDRPTRENAVRQVYLRDAIGGRTTRVTPRRPTARCPNGDSSVPSISADGRHRRLRLRGVEPPRR